MRHALATLQCGPKERLASPMRVRADVERWWRPGYVRGMLDCRQTSSDERCQRQILFPSTTERYLRRIQDGLAGPLQQRIRYARQVAYSSSNQGRNPWLGEYFRYPSLQVTLLVVYNSITLQSQLLNYSLTQSTHYILLVRLFPGCRFYFRCWVQLHQWLMSLVFRALALPGHLDALQNSREV